MKCTNCGFEATSDFNLCEKCGAPAPVLEEVIPESTGNRLLSVLKDKLFLTICILFSVSVAAGVFSGTIPIFYVLFTIFFWLAYAQGQKGIVDERHLRSISGTVYANYIVINVLSIILIVCGVIFAVIFGLFVNPTELINSPSLELGELAPIISAIPRAFYLLLGWILGFFVVGIGAVCLVFNILGMRKIPHFAQWVYKSASLEITSPTNVKTVKGWLIFFAVAEGISALSSLASSAYAAMSAGCITAVIILACVLLDRYFAD